jgi:hypothetical protein
MDPFTQRRLLAMLAAALVLTVLLAGMALARRDVASAATAQATPPRDTITVRGTRCPKSHPHKVGSYSSWSSTQVDGGEVIRRSRRAVLCSR